MHAPIAELVKLQPFKLRIQGSSPCGSTFIAPLAEWIGSRLLICARNCDKGSNPLGCTYYVLAGFRSLSPARNKKDRPSIMRL